MNGKRNIINGTIFVCTSTRTADVTRRVLFAYALCVMPAIKYKKDDMICDHFQRGKAAFAPRLACASLMALIPSRPRPFPNTDNFVSVGVSSMHFARAFAPASEISLEA